jgi:hypothetical protein
MSGNSTEIKSFAFSPNNINPGLTGVTGVNVSAPNATNGSAINNLTNINNTQSGSLSIQSYISSLYDSTGLTSKNSAAVTNQTITPATNNKTPLAAETNSSDALPPLLAAKTSSQSPTESINEKRNEMGEGSGNSLSFPSTLQSNNNFTRLKLQFLKYDRSDAQAAGTLGPDGGALYLPLPENLQIDFNVSYDTIDTGAAGVISAQIGKSAAAIEAGDINVKDTLVASLKTAANLGERRAYAAIDTAEQLASAIVGPIAGSAQIAQKFLQQIPNPHPGVFFKGLPLRAFQFNWKLVPLDSDDAENLKNIIDSIKRNILPATAQGGERLTYPNMLQITFDGLGANRYTKYLPCFVENLSINYTGEGTSAFFVNGAPVSILLTMQLRETEMFTRDKV